MKYQVTVLLFILIARLTSCLHIRDDTAFMDMIDQIWLPSGNEFNCTKYRLLIEEFTGVFSGDNEVYYRSITCLEDDGNYSVYYTYQREPVFTGTRSEYLLTLPNYTDENASDYSDISDELDTSNPLKRRAQLSSKNKSYFLWETKTLLIDNSTKSFVSSCTWIGVLLAFSHHSYKK